jgi:hypothetical protein
MCLEAEIISLDGKTLRHSDDKSTGKKAIHQDLRKDTTCRKNLQTSLRGIEGNFGSCLRYSDKRFSFN